MPILRVFVDIIQWILIPLADVDNISQKSGCPYFCNSNTKTSIKTHRFQNRVARNRRNFLHIWNIQIFNPLFYLINNNVNGQMIISLFYLKIILVAASSVSWYCWSVSAVIYIIIYPLITSLFVFYVHFVSYSMSMQYLQGLYMPILEYYIKYIY